MAFPREDLFLLLDFAEPLLDAFEPRALFEPRFAAPLVRLALFDALAFFGAFFEDALAPVFFAPEDLLDLRAEDLAPPRLDDFCPRARAVFNPVFAATFFAPELTARFADPAASRTAALAVATF